MSVAVQVTVVVPTGKQPGASLENNNIPQLSVGVAPRFISQPKSSSAKHLKISSTEISGSSSSVTVTVKEQETVFPDGSVAVAVTVVVPTGKKLPETGL